MLSLFLTSILVNYFIGNDVPLPDIIINSLNKYVNISPVTSADISGKMSKKYSKYPDRVEMVIDDYNA